MSGAAAGEILAERRDEVAWITLHRPERLNAFAGEMRDRLAAEIERAAGDRSVRAIVVTGSGRAFSAGADVDVMEELLRRDDRDAFLANVEAGMRVVRSIAAAPQPVIAGINGVAAGAGASLAIAADVRIASEAATIGFTFNRIGLHPDWGASHHLPRLVGTGLATELMMTARMIDAREALRIGLVERVAPADGFRSALEQLAAEVAERAPVAIRRIKRSLRDLDGLERALGTEYDAQAECFSSEDVREGIAAFREKRSPHFAGR